MTPGGIENAIAHAWLVDDPGSSELGYADEFGDYVITGLAPGDYRVTFFDPCSTGETYWCTEAREYAVSFWNGRQSASAADIVTVAAGATSGNVDAVLEGGATLSGRVVDADNPTTGLAEVGVYVYDTDGGLFRDDYGYWPFDASGWSLSAVTDNDGNYEVVGPLNDGDYKVLFQPLTPWASEDFTPAYWGGASFFEAADVLTVTGTDPVTADGALTRGGSISGTISRDGVSPFVAETRSIAYAYAYNPDTLAWEEVGSDYSTPTGEYSIPGLAAGTYRVGFHDHASNVAVSSTFHWGTPTVYYDAQPTIDLADDIVVVNGVETPGIDVILPSNPVTGIEATVTLTGGVPAEGGCMYAYLDGTMWDPMSSG